MKTSIFKLFKTITVILLLHLLHPIHVSAQAPTTPSTNLSISSIDGNRFYVSFTRGDGARRIIIASTSPITAAPINGADYLAADFGQGNEISPGQFVVYNGTSNQTFINGLNHSTTYYFKIFEYNGSNFTTEYLVSEFLGGSTTTLTTPTVQASSITFSNVTGFGMTVNWVGGNGNGRILIGRAGSPVEVEPQDLINYSGGTGPFTNGTNLGNGHYVQYIGSATSTNISGLTANQTYHFAIFEYNGNNGKVYLRPGSSGSQLTASAPTEAATNFSVSTGNVDGDRFYYSLTRGNGARRVIVAKEGSPVTALPEDGLSYSANTTFGSGDEISPGEFVVYDGTSNQSWLFGLQPGTTYHLAIFEYNGTGTETFYLTDPYLAGSRATLNPPTVQASITEFDNVAGTTMTVRWSNGNGDGRILIGRAGSPVEVEPQDLINYSGGSGPFTNGTNLGDGHYVQYIGSATSTNISGLTANQTYHFTVFEYTGNSGKQYLRPGSSGSQLTASAPTEAATNFSVSIGNVDGDRFYYSLTRGNGARRVIIAKEGSPVTALPEDGLSYSANTTFGSGDEISPGEFVVYDGTSNQSWLFGLQPGTTYHLAIFEYNGTGTETFYLTDPYLAASRATLNPPTVQASITEFDNVAGTTMTVRWSNGNGDGRILIGRAGSPVEVEPQDLINYSGGTGPFTNGTNLGDGHYVQYIGSATSTNISGLTANQTYHFTVFEYTGNSGKQYLRPGSSGSQLTASAPTEAATNFSVSTGNVDGDRFYYSLTRGNGARRVIIAKEGSPVTALPEDGLSYSANTTFGSGDEISPGEFVVYDGTSNQSWLFGLQPGTTYHLAIFEYNGTGTETFYLTDPYLAGSRATLGHPTVQSSNAFTSSRSNTSINISWTRGDGSHRILIGRRDGPVNVEPQDFSNYTASGVFGNREIGTGNYVLFAGTGNNINVTNLEPGTNYHFALFEYNGTSAKVYLRPGYQFALETFGERPTVQTSNAMFSNVDFTSFQVNFVPGNGTRRLVLAKAGISVNAGPADFNTYSANHEFGQGDEIGSGNFVVYNDSGEGFSLEGLEAGITYHLAFYEYTLSEQGELYLAPGYTSSQRTTEGLDLALTSIINPESACDLGEAEIVQVLISNISSTPVEAFSVAYSLDGDPPIIEELEGANLILGNSTYIHTFSQPVNLSSKQSYQLTANLVLAGDVNPNNDALTITIDHFPDLVTTITENSAIIPGESIVLEATGGTSYLWSTNETTASITAEPEVTTEYTVLITDENGCSESRMVIVEVLPDPCLNIICPDGTICSNGECVTADCESALSELNVTPDMGTNETEFTFTITYFDPNNHNLSSGYPRLELDSDGNGVITDPGDLSFVMEALDPSDLDLTNGKTYQVRVSGLNNNINWRSRVVAKNEFECIATTPFINKPNVTESNLDLAIYANNISFSNENPNLNETITIFARVRNISDFPAENFVVSAYDGDVQIFTTIIDNLGPRSHIDVSWQYSFEVAGFYPIKVVVDETNVVQEINELNNFAIRPVIAGNYVLPGGIDVTAAPNTTTAYVGDRISISGYASYFGIDENINPDVAGANVTLSYENVTFQTTTTSNGTFSRSVQMPNTPGIYTFEGSVTDYTLTGEIPSFQVEVIPLPDKADLIANISLDQNAVVVGEEISGLATVTNIGTLTASNFTFRYSSCEGIIGEVAINSLAPGETLSYNFTETIVSNIGSCFNKNNCTFLAIADVFNEVDDRNRNNNTANRRATIYPNIPDLTPARSLVSPSSTMVQPFNFTVRVDNIAASIIEETFNVNVYVDGALIDSRSFNNLERCGIISYPLSVEFETQEDHEIRIKVDEPLGTGNIEEFNENNNEYVRLVRYNPALPNLFIINSYLSVEPELPAEGENFLIKARVRNTGQASIEEAFDVNFQITEDGVIRDETFTVSEGLAGNTEILLEYVTSLATYGNHSVLVDLDPLNLIVETSEFDNKANMPLCVDFEAAQLGPVLSSGFFIDTPYTLTGRVKNLGLFTATNVSVDFLLDGVMIGSTIIPEIKPTYNGSGRQVTIPYTFRDLGTFTLEMVVDSDDLYIECDETNNNISRTILVRAPQPDLRIFSEYISPTSLNPEIDEEINLFISYENNGANTTSPFKIRVTVDDVPLGEDISVEGLGAGQLATVAVDTPYSSSTSGVKIIRGFVDIDQEADDLNYSNNEASRAVIVGAAPNLLFTKIDFSTYCPQVGELVQINVEIQNEGELGSDAEVHFYYLTENNTVPIDIVPITADLQSSTSTSITYTVINPEYKILAEIKNSSILEFNELDNEIIGEFLDTIAPNLSIPADILVNINENSCEPSDIVLGEASATDNCSEVTISNNAPEIFPMGQTEVTWTAIDASGNTTELIQLVTIIDDEDSTTLDTSITQVSGNLISNQDGATYQWYQCPSTLLSDETNQSFTPTENGDYKVEIIVGDCIVESDCVTVEGLSIDEAENLTNFSMYPNPANNLLYINTNLEGSFTIINQIGQTVQTFKVQPNIVHVINVENLADGVYYIKGKNELSNRFRKLIIKK